VLASTLAAIECRLVETIERGDHSIFLGEVVDARVPSAPAGRPDDATLVLKDLGDSTFYGG
jgi:flavin reductase (DIM6/NTAB) family NADH-FMN oxidoreductase RutF